MPRFSVSVDIGGTFTDFVLLDNQLKSVTTAKVLSTPGRPDDAIFTGFGQFRQSADFDLASCDVFLHATTVITNAVIERRGHDFILLHTEGFGTTLETGRERRYNISNLRLAFPRPLTRHRLKVPVLERVSHTGEVLQQPERAVLLREVHRLVDETGIRNFAICFLHAFQNPANEQLVAQWLSESVPDAVTFSIRGCQCRSGHSRCCCAAAPHSFGGMFRSCMIFATFTLSRLARCITSAGDP